MVVEMQSVKTMLKDEMRAAEESAREAHVQLAEMQRAAEEAQKELDLLKRDPQDLAGIGLT
eukprot:3903048-Prymnesium_polylepis.1